MRKFRRVHNVRVKSNRCTWLILSDKGATGLQASQTELDGQGNTKGDAAMATPACAAISTARSTG